MTIDNEKQWLKDQYENKEADPSAIEDWILENGDSPEFDDMMLELLETTEYFDPVSSSKGYSLFKTRIKEHEKSRRRSIMGKVLKSFEHIAALLLVPVSLLTFYMGTLNYFYVFTQYTYILRSIFMKIKNSKRTFN